MRIGIDMSVFVENQKLNPNSISFYPIILKSVISHCVQLLHFLHRFILFVRLHCTFIDTSLNFYHHRKSQHQNYIYNILNNIIECIRLAEHQKPNDLYQCDAQPNIRIIVCMFCGDPFSVESILSPILSEPTSTMSSERSVIFETFLGDTKRKIEVIFSSYHGANAFRDELVHGFILLYSTKRRASLATLK